MIVATRAQVDAAVASWRSNLGRDLQRRTIGCELQRGSRAVYFARSGDVLKIGSTGSGVASRMRSLSQQNGAGFVAVAVIVECVSELDVLHVFDPFRSSAFRTGREWFAWNGHVEDFLRILGSVATEAA